MVVDHRIDAMRLFAAAAAGIDVTTLEQIHRTGKAKPKAVSIAIARGLAYDPHVDGRLRLTLPGRAKLAASRASA